MRSSIFILLFFTLYGCLIDHNSYENNRVNKQPAKSEKSPRSFSDDLENTMPNDFSNTSSVKSSYTEDVIEYGNFHMSDETISQNEQAHISATVNKTPFQENSPAINHELIHSASSQYSFDNPEEYTCYYKTYSLKSNGEYEYAEETLYLPNKPHWSGGIKFTGSSWVYHATGCAAVGSDLLVCNSKEIILLISGGEKVACNFSLNIPGKNMFSHSHYVSDPRSFGLKMKSHDDKDSPENKCITCDCDIDENCYQKKSVTIKRIGKNVFRYSTTSELGFQTYSKTAYGIGEGHFEYDEQFEDFFTHEIMK